MMRPTDAPSETGTVVEVHARRAVVRPESGSGDPLDCAFRGRLGRGPREEQNVLVVGDRVRFERDPNAIVEVLRRRNELTREGARSARYRHVIAANVDQALIVAAAVHPPLRTGFVDRCVASAALRDIEPFIAVNKTDLLDESGKAEITEIVAGYAGAGIGCVALSVTEGTGLDVVGARLASRTTVVVGQSGVGKTSLLNALCPGLDFAIGEVSGATSKGRHTTTTSRLVPIGDGGFVMDTPGLRVFGLETMEPVQLALAYPEFAAFRGACSFSACTHVHEPACAVKDAVASGSIAAWRYENYVRILGTLGEP